jgi:N-acetylglucosamine kinase-like BadF-type ATPase
MPKGDSRYILGLAGSTMESAAAIATADGDVFTVARGGPLNLQEFAPTVCYDNLLRLLVKVDDYAKTLDPTWPERLQSITCSIEGILDQTDKDAVGEFLNGTFLTPSQRSIAIDVLSHRGEAAHLASFWGGSGIVIKVGTSAWCYGGTDSGRTCRAGGWGPYLDDDGGAFSIGLAALQHLSKITDKRTSPGTAFAREFLHALSSSRFEDVARKLNRLEKRHEIRTDISDIARVIAKLADEDGNIEASKLLDDAAEKIFLSFHAVAAIFGANTVLPVVLQGALAENCRLLASSITKRVTENYPHVRLRMGQFRPVVGALIKGLQREISSPPLGRLHASLLAHRELWAASAQSDPQMLYISPNHSILQSEVQWQLPS